MNNPILPWLAAAIIVLLVLSWGRIPRWLESRPHRVTVRSEVHGLLELAIKQNTALIEIRDCLREMSKIGYAKQIDGAGAAIIEELRGAKSCISEFRDLMDARFPTRQDGEKMVGLLGQIRDSVEPKEGGGYLSVNVGDIDRLLSQIYEVLKSYTEDAGPDEIIGAIRNVGQVVMALKQQFDGQDRDSDFFHAAKLMRQSLPALLEAIPKILSQLEQNDKRMFEFVAATKGIMKAMNGGGYEETDLLIDEAKRIMDYAIEQGVELTLEDAIKRARSKRTYARS